ncbi:hypothetical protein JHK82_052449 [Glycine max]|nr:hypothetical protein JHK85_053144 [Glycine max]KAG5085052.1 hypothetical protein JHK82_052449 [Glycine max]
MTFEVGAVLEDANWQAPVNCFDENDKEKNIPILGSAVRGGSLGSYDIGSATWADLRKAPLQSAMEVTYICVHFVLKELVRKSISETEVSNVSAMSQQSSALESGSFHSPVDEKLILKFVVEEMMIGHTDHISESRSLKDQILGYSGSELSDDEEEDCLEQILYSTSFEELASNYVKYDTVIWLAISLLLVLAWRIGLLMLLYLPIRRYVLQKDLSSCILYVTCIEVVYKVSRPSFIPFWGTVTIERRVPLSLVIDIIIEQDFLNSLSKLPAVYIWGSFNVIPFNVILLSTNKGYVIILKATIGLQMIVTEASKITQDVSTSGKHADPSTDEENICQEQLRDQLF